MSVLPPDDDHGDQLQHAAGRHPVRHQRRRRTTPALVTHPFHKVFKRKNIGKETQAVLLEIASTQGVFDNYF